MLDMGRYEGSPGVHVDIIRVLTTKTCIPQQTNLLLIPRPWRLNEEHVQGRKWIQFLIINIPACELQRGGGGGGGGDVFLVKMRICERPDA